MERNCRLIRNFGWRRLWRCCCYFLAFALVVRLQCVRVFAFFLYQQQTNLVFVGVLRLCCLPLLLWMWVCACLYLSLSVVCSVCISKPLIFFALFMSSWEWYERESVCIDRNTKILLHDACSISSILAPSLSFSSMIAGSVQLLTIASTASFNVNLISSHFFHQMLCSF